METTQNRALHNPSPIFKSRLKNLRELHKSKTTQLLARPLTTRASDLYSISKIHPKKSAYSKERTSDEKLFQSDPFSESLKKKTERKKQKTKKTSNEQNSILGISLKSSLTVLEEKLLSTEAQFNKTRNRSQDLILENEIRYCLEECSRLKLLLNEFMKLKDFPTAFVEFENKIAAKTQIIMKLKNDVKDAKAQLSQLREENLHFREKISAGEKKKKTQIAPKNSEVNSLKDENENLKIFIKKIQENFENKEKNYIDDINYYKDSLDNEVAKNKQTEKELDDRLIAIKTLKKQVENLKHESLKRKESSFSKSTHIFADKDKNPPRLFKKINEISKEKCLMVSVLLTLVEKNHNGYIEAEDLKKCIILHGKNIKRKHIDEALSIMKCGPKNIPRRLLEEWYEKYDYDDIYFSSSEEEIRPIERKLTERLTFKLVKPDPIYNQIVIPDINSQVYIPKEAEVQMVPFSEVKLVFDRIKLYMQDKYFYKNRFLNAIFGNNFDPDTPVSADEIAEVLNNSQIFLGSFQEIFQFSKFLIEPEGETAMKESKYKKIKGKVLEFSKKLQKFIPDWEVFDKHKAHFEIYAGMCEKKEDVWNKSKEKLSFAEGSLEVHDFEEVLKGLFNFSNEALQYLYLVSYTNSKRLNRICLESLYSALDLTQSKISEIKLKNFEFLKNVKNCLDRKGKSFEAYFEYEKGFLVSLDTVETLITNLEVNRDDQFLAAISIGRSLCNLGLFRVLML